MTGPLPPTAGERIDEACDRFEAAWKAGQQPQIEDYLGAEAGDDRETLRQELLHLEAHYRRRLRGELTVAGGTVGRTADQPFILGYEVLGELGRGGMGVVYLARQLRPNRLVALKMITAGAHAGVREVERFQREAEAVAQLQHPHIVQVYEVGEQEGRPYFAMEYVAGGSLDRYLLGKPQPPRAAAELIERLALAIHHAHGRGIIHRDLKPANILLQQDAGGTTKDVNDEGAAARILHHLPKITDFGLAKLLDAATANPTQSGDLVGTPSYMAPEQVGGGVEHVGAATDVYGLGAILYELLSGRPPFRGDTALETMYQVRTFEPVSPSRLQPKCPRDLVTICLKCLGKQPRRRYASALEMADDLRRFLDGKPIWARPVGPLRHVLKWTRRQPVVASLAGLLLLAVTLGVGTGSWFWWQAEASLKQTEFALEKERAAQVDRLATLDRYQVALAHREWLANNGRRTAALLDACTEEQQQAWEWRYLDRLRHSALHTFAGHRHTVQALAIDNTGRHVASVGHDASVRLWDLDTGQGTLLGNHPPQTLALAVAYSPDGRLLASSGSRDGLVKLWDTTTGDARELAFGPQGEIAVWGLAFDRTSRFLAMGGPRRVKVWDTRDQNWAFDRVADNGSIAQVRFSPDGSCLATASKKVKVWNLKAPADQPLHDWPGNEGGTFDLAFHPDGDLLASGGRDGLVRVHSLETDREVFVLDAHQLSVTSVCFSPDGQRLATAGQEGDMHIWSVNERRRLFTLHGHSGAVYDLAYTPRGDRLVSAGADGLVRVWDAAGSQETVTLPIAVPDEVSALAFGPSGRFLAWGDIQGRIRVRDTVLKKEVLRLFEPNPRGRDPIVAFVFSPDGRRVAWRREYGPARLRDLENGAEIPLLGARTNLLGLAFSADGEQLLAATLENEKLQLHDLRTGQDLLTLPRPGKSIAFVVWSPDASCFVTVEDGSHARLWATESARPLGELENQPSLTCLTFSGDGRRLAVGGAGGGLRVWDVAANRETMAVTGHSSRLFGLALSPDGRRLASAAADCTAKLWDTQTGHEVLTLRTQLHERSPLAFSPDGADLVSVCSDNRLQIWSTRGLREFP